jgi:uncharacterized protein (DUF736 family)
MSAPPQQALRRTTHRNRFNHFEKGNHIMSIIGNFTRDGENYPGIIQTLAFSGPVTLEPVKERSENGPDFVAFTVPGRQRGRVEIGSARRQRSEAGNEYLNVKLDEPSFPAPIFCRLIQLEGQEGYSLIWSRS